MKNNYLENKKFYKEIKETDDIKISLESLSCSGKPEKTVHYPFTITNTSLEPVSLKIELDKAGWETMDTEIEKDTIDLKSGETVETELKVELSERLAPGGYENQEIIIKKCGSENGRDELLDKIIFTTLRHLPHPYLLHTEEGWENVKNKMNNYEWMADILKKTEEKYKDWQVPDIDPSGDFLFQRDSCDPIRPLVIAWKLSDDKEKTQEYADKIKEFLLKLSDPERGYPETGKGSSHYAVKEGKLFQIAAVAYDLICDSGILNPKEKNQVEKTLYKFIRDWSRSERIVVEREQFTSGLGLDNEFIGNHQLSIVVAAIYISLVLQDFNHLNRFLYGPGGFKEQMVNGMMDDGFWYETDPGYHMLVADFFMKIARACKPWGINLFDAHFQPRYHSYASLRKSETNQKFGPNYRNNRSISDMVDCLVPLGDYRGIIFSNNKSWEVRLGGGRLEPFYEYYRKPEYAWALKQKKRGSLQTLLYGVPELPEVEDPRPEMVNSENAGFYVLRSSFDKEEPEEQLQAVLKCGTPGGGHRHYDQTDLLSIMRYGRSFYNTQSAWWGGVYHHMYNDWLIKSANHNMVIVDQGNQGVTRPEKLLLKKEEKYKSTAVQVKAPWADMSFWPKGTEEKIKDLGTILQRRLMTLTEDYIIVADYLSDISQGKEDKGSHIYDWLIHPVGYKGIKTEEKEFLHHKEKFAEKGACQYITDCEWYRYKSPACIQFEQFFQNDSKNKDGVLKLDVHALWPVEGKLMLGFDPLGQEKNEDLPDEERRRTLSLRTEGKETRYLTLIEAYEQESKIADIEVINADKVRVVLKDGRVQVHEISNFTEKGEDITAEMIEK